MKKSKTYRAADEASAVERLPAHPVFEAFDTRTGAYLGVVSTKATAFEAEPYAADLYGVPRECVKARVRKR